MNYNSETNDSSKIVEHTKTIAKKPIKISNDKEILKEERNTVENSGFEKKKNSPKFLIWILLLIFIIGSIFIIINNIPTDIETIKDSVVMIKVYDDKNNEISTGSAFCAYRSNYIITNYHVIEGACKIKVFDDYGNQYVIDTIKIFNKDNDLAILQGNFELKPLKIGNTNNLKAGENITTIGSPKGQLNTVSKGIISNADSDYEIRITTPISPR